MVWSSHAGDNMWQSGRMIVWTEKQLQEKL